jgi:hypothetical protein
LVDPETPPPKKLNAYSGVTRDSFVDVASRRFRWDGCVRRGSLAVAHRERFFLECKVLCSRLGSSDDDDDDE